DAEITRAVEDFVHAGFPRDAAAVLLVEVDGLPAGTDAAAQQVGEIGRAHAARTVRVAADEAERALLWKGRKSAFGAIARIAPNYYLHDAVVPRTRLVEVMRAVYAIAARHDLLMMNVFHAGDGNLHPLIVFDRREPGVMERVEAAGAAIITACVEAGGVLSGEHGIGLGKRDYMPLIFSADDLDAQARLRAAYEPAEMIVRCGAGTTVAELDQALAEHGQCVALPAWPQRPGAATTDGATVGGVLAVGRSGVRRLGYGPVRDVLLEARYVSADGR